MKFSIKSRKGAAAAVALMLSAPVVALTGMGGTAQAATQSFTIGNQINFVALSGSAIIGSRSVGLTVIPSVAGPGDPIEIQVSSSNLDFDNGPAATVTAYGSRIDAVISFNGADYQLRGGRNTVGTNPGQRIVAAPWTVSSTLGNSSSAVAANGANPEFFPGAGTTGGGASTTGEGTVTRDNAAANPPLVNLAAPASVGTYPIVLKAIINNGVSNFAPPCAPSCSPAAPAPIGSGTNRTTDNFDSIYNTDAVTTTAGVAGPGGAAGSYQTNDPTSYFTFDPAVELTVAPAVPQVALAKTVDRATIAEGAADSTVTYTLTISNPGSVDATVTALVDDQVSPLPSQCLDLVGDVLNGGDEVTCSYDVDIDATDPQEVINTASVTVDDGAGNDPATAEDSVTVTVTDVLPTITVSKTATDPSLAAPANFEYTVDVVNTSPEAVEITASDDTLFPGVFAAECPALAAAASIPAGGTATCTYSIAQPDPGTFENTFSVTVTDNEDNTVDGSDTASVAAFSTSASVAVDLLVTPPSREEPGGAFDFTLDVISGSTQDQNIDALTAGLSAQCDDLVGTTLAAGATATCEYSISRSAIDDYTSTVEVTTSVSEPASTDTASASVDYSVTDALPALSVSKTASPGTLPAGGGEVTFTVNITNESGEADSLEIVSASDTRVDLAVECADLVGEVIAPGDTKTCEYTLTFDKGGEFSNAVTVTAKDEENNQVAAADTAVVVVENNTPPTTTAPPTTAPPTTAPPTTAPPTTAPPTTAPPTTAPPTTATGVPSTVIQTVNGVVCRSALSPTAVPWEDPGSGGSGVGAAPIFTIALTPQDAADNAVVKVQLSYPDGIGAPPTAEIEDGAILPKARMLLNGRGLVNQALIIQGVQSPTQLANGTYKAFPGTAVLPTARVPGAVLEGNFTLPAGTGQVTVTFETLVFDSSNGFDPPGFFWPERLGNFAAPCNKATDPRVGPAVAIGTQAGVPFTGAVPTVTPIPSNTASVPPVDDDPTDTDTDPSGSGLPSTGGNATTSLLIALVLFQLGLILAVRSVRATPRATGQHA